MTNAPVIVPFKGVMPKIHPSAFIAPGAIIIGDVEIGADTSIWFGCVLRGDVNVIRIGARSNIQDGSIIHVSTGGQGTHVGDDVLVGHMALLHDCRVESGAFIGMKSALLDGAVVEGGAMLAAGALLTPNKRVPRGQLWAGNPAKLMRELSEKDLQGMKEGTARYVTLMRDYQAS